MKKETDRNDRKQDYEKLGRMLVELNDHGIRPGKGYYRSAFLRGVIGGFGGVLGATVVVAALLWILGLFGSIGFLSGFVETIRNTVSAK